MLQDEAFQAFSGSIQAVSEERHALQQAVHDAKRRLQRVQTQIKAMEGEAGSIRRLRDATLQSLRQAEEKIAFSSQVRLAFMPAGVSKAQVSVWLTSLRFVYLLVFTGCGVSPAIKSFASVTAPTRNLPAHERQASFGGEGGMVSAVRLNFTL